MTNKEKYNDIFISVFETEESNLNECFTRDNVDNWNSLAHITLISELEEAFGIMFDPDDILNLNSYSAGIKILNNYEIEL